MHRPRLTIAFIVVLALVSAIPAAADVTVGATCTGGTITCTVGIFHTADDWQGVVLQWRYLNVCDDPWRPVAMEPLPMPAVFEEHTLTFPAHDPDEWLEYQAFYLDADGNLYQADAPSWTWSNPEVTCANPILVRGYLHGDEGVLWIEPCADTCWFRQSMVFAWDLEPGTWEHLVNADTPVNIWGHYRRDEMPGASGIMASAIAPVAPGEDCNPAIATEAASWGTVKALYR